MLNSIFPLKGHSTKHSAHALSLDILEEIFAFVPYECCQNSWIASSKLHIPLATKLKKLRQYQDWIQEQINQLRTGIAELKSSTEVLKVSMEVVKVNNVRISASIEELKVKSERLNVSIEELKDNTEKLKVSSEKLNVSIEELKVNTEKLKEKKVKEIAALKPKSENCQSGIAELEEGKVMNESMK
ncbi:hypothetical protein Ddc_15972 [Ditylenchus destructor]|nr:hypothetical protein Ddc_15972 [Ditylenchus destructor]